MCDIYYDDAAIEIKMRLRCYEEEFIWGFCRELDGMLVAQSCPIHNMQVSIVLSTHATASAAVVVSAFPVWLLRLVRS